MVARPYNPYQIIMKLNLDVLDYREKRGAYTLTRSVIRQIPCVHSARSKKVRPQSFSELFSSRSFFATPEFSKCASLNFGVF